MFDLDRTEIAFRKFAQRVQQQTRSNISKKDLKASGTLRNDVKFYTKRNKNSIELIYERPKYADFQDQGVSGVQKKFNTPFSYKPSSNLVGAEYHKGMFAKWARQKGIKPRNKKTGKFMSFKAFGFIVANKIKIQGIKPKLFFSKPFRKQTKTLPKPIEDAFASDVDRFLKITLE